MVKATHRVLDKFEIENVTQTKITNKTRIDKNLVAPVPLREAIINAIVHNDYTREIPPVFEIFSDRIVISSYGGLLPGQSGDDFFSYASMPRNRELMRVFKDIGLVEHLGSGMSRILKEYTREIFEISEHFIRVTFPFYEISTEHIKEEVADKVADKVSKTQLRILDLIQRKPAVTISEMMDELQMSDYGIRKNILKLKADGILVRRGSNKKGYWEIHV